MKADDILSFHQNALKNLEIQNNCEIYISGDQESVIGCMTIVGLTVGGRFVFELEELKHDGPVKEGCGTLCVDGQCNKVIFAITLDQAVVHRTPFAVLSKNSYFLIKHFF